MSLGGVRPRTCPWTESTMTAITRRGMCVGLTVQNRHEIVAVGKTAVSPRRCLLPADELRVARERVKRFERLGGIDLSHLDVEDPFRIEVEVGTAEHNHAIFRFRCELCGRVERNAQDMPPACTGPSWLDVHPLEPMTRVED